VHWHVPQVGPGRAEAEGDLARLVPGLERAAVDQIIEEAPPAPNSATEPSHTASARGGRLAGRRHRTAITASTAQPSTTMLVYRVNTAASMARNPSSPIQVRRRAAAAVSTGPVSSASMAHSNAPVPAAISDASVKVGM